MARLPAKVSALLESIAKEFPRLLGKDLVGVYLYGSLTQAAFDAARSDIDMVVAVKADLSEKQFTSVGEWLRQSAIENEWTKGIQMMIIGEKDILTMDARACHYQFGEFRRDGSDGNPIPWINILKSGITLYGTDARAFVPEITGEMLFAALVREAGYLREELIEKPDSEWRDVPKYRSYAVLTVCRILYSHEKGTIVSKPRAAKWAINNLPPKWHDLITAALGHDTGRKAKLPLRPLRAFVKFAERELAFKPK